MIRRLWWSWLALRRGVPTCRECGRPKTAADGQVWCVCVPCDEAWKAKMRAIREGKA